MMSDKRRRYGLMTAAGLGLLVLISRAGAAEEQPPENGDGGDDDDDPDPPDDGDDDDDDFYYEESTSATELTLHTNSQSGPMHYRIESVGEIERGDNLMDHDEVFQDGDLWIAEGQFGPAGTDTYHVYATGLEFFGVYDLDTSTDPWDYTDTATPVNEYGTTWGGNDMHPDAFAGETDVAEADDGDMDPSPGDVGIRHDMYDGPLAGGSGMPSDIYYSASDADYTVSSGSQLQSAINSSSHGDVIYVQGSVSGGVTVNQSGITIAGNRGQGSDGRINGNLEITANDVGLNSISYGGGSISGQGFVALNVDINGSIDISHREPGARFTQCSLHGTGGTLITSGAYQSGDTVSACGGSWHMTSYDNRTIFEYCDFYDVGRVGMGTTGYWHVRDCHFHGQATSRTTVVEVRAPNACRVSGSGSVNACGSPCGTAIIEHCRNEMQRGSEGCRLFTVRGTPYVDTAVVRYNYAPVNSQPGFGCEAGGPWPHTFSNQLILQNAGDNGTSPDNIEYYGNQL